MNFFLLLMFAFILMTFKNDRLYSSEYYKQLIAYWSFDDSTANDHSGNGYHGSKMNNPTPCEGISGAAMYFVGKNNYMIETNDISLIGDHILLPPIDFNDLGEFTITMWVKEDAVSYQAGESYIEFGHLPGYLGITHASDETDLTQNIRYAVGCVRLHLDPIKVEYNYNLRERWIFLSMVYENNIVKAYLNGKLEGSKYQLINISSDRAALARHWWAYEGRMRTSARFTGAIDEVMIFKRALKDEEIKELHENPGRKDSISVSSSLLEVCAGDSVRLTASVGLTDYEWFKEGSQQPFAKDTRTVWVKESGSYYCKGINKNNDKVISNYVNVMVGNANYFEIVSLPSEGLDYDSTFVNSPKCQTLTIRNRTSQIRTLNSIRFKQSSVYYVPAGELPVAVAPGAEQKVRVCFKPEKEGFIEDSLVIDDLCFSYSAYLKGIGAWNINKAVVTTSNTLICPGDSVMLQGPDGYNDYEWHYLETGELVNAGSRTIYVKRAGQYQLTVNVPPSTKLISDIINVVFIDDNPYEYLMSSPQKYVFDTTGYGTFICRGIEIRNSSGKPQTLTEAYMFVNVNFSMPRTQFPIHFEPYETKQIEVCYAPSALGVLYDTLKIDHICLPLNLPLEAYCPANEWGIGSKCEAPLNLITVEVYGKFTSTFSKPYPNPASGIVRIDYEKAEPTGSNTVLTCRIYDMFGVCLSKAEAEVERFSELNQMRCEKGFFQIDLSRYPRGVYSAVIATPAGAQAIRIIAD